MVEKRSSEASPFEKLVARLGGFKRWPKKVQQEKYTAEGLEIMDPVPMAPPVGYNPQPSMIDIVRLEILKNALHIKHLEQQWERESIEEADDFAVEDDFPMESRWENDRDPSIAELKKRIDDMKKQMDEKRAAGAAYRAERDETLRDGGEDRSPEPAPPSKKGGGAGVEGSIPGEAPLSGRQAAKK